MHILLALALLLGLAACGAIHPAEGPPTYNRTPMGGGSNGA
jgi:predicted small lipoprotein YifL